MKAKTIGAFLLLMLLLITACQKKENERLLGKYPLKSKYEKLIPYKDGQIVQFLAPNNDTLNFTVKRTHGWYKMIEPCYNCYWDPHYIPGYYEVEYDYTFLTCYSPSIRIYIKIDGTGMRGFNVTVKSDTNFLAIKINDQYHAGLPYNENGLITTFYYPVEIFDTYSVGGMTYYNVVATNLANDYPSDTIPYNYKKIFYNADYGIIELKLSSGRSIIRL